MLRRRHPAGHRLADGPRKWKGGRYGHGQLVLLADQDLLLVVTEEGALPQGPTRVTATRQAIIRQPRFTARAGVRRREAAFETTGSGSTPTLSRMPNAANARSS